MTMSTSMFHTHRVVPLHYVFESHQRAVCERGVDGEKVHICRRVWSLDTTFHIPWDDEVVVVGHANQHEEADAVTPWTMIGLLSDVLVGV